MADHQVHAQFIIPSTSGLAKDTCVNNWSFNVDTAVTDLQTAAGIITGDLVNFYTNVQAYWPITVNDANISIKFYDRGDAAPRVPFHISDSLGLNATGADPMPAEVAVVLSFHAAISSGVIAARRRGRIFFGPLVATAGELAHFDSAPKSLLITALVGAASDLLTASNSHPAISWGVRSDMDDVTSDVVGGWVDNAFDTQRRRGHAADQRIFWP